MFLSTPAAGVGSAAALRPRRPSFSTRHPPKLGLAGFALAAAPPPSGVLLVVTQAVLAVGPELHKISLLCSNWGGGHSHSLARRRPN